jgi:hypothetical protein
MFCFLYYLLMRKQFDLTLTFREAGQGNCYEFCQRPFKLWPDQIFFFYNWGKSLQQWQKNNKIYALQGLNFEKNAKLNLAWPKLRHFFFLHRNLFCLVWLSCRLCLNGWIFLLCFLQGVYYLIWPLLGLAKIKAIQN